MDKEKQTGDADIFQSDLDAKHGEWQSRHKKRLNAILFVVWTPSVLFIVTALLSVAYPTPDRGPLVVFHSILVFGSIIVNGALAMTVAIWAGASLQLSPESFSDSAKPNGYARFRLFVRLVCLKWIAWLMLAPTCVGTLIWQFINLSVVLPSHSEGQHPGNSDAYVIFALLFFVPLLGSIYGWCLLELAQYLTLRFPKISTATRVWVSLLPMGVFFGFVSFWSFIGGTLPTSPEMQWLDGLVGILVFVIPLVLALYMMFATRKPAREMLERY